MNTVIPEIMYRTRLVTLEAVSKPLVFGPGMHEHNARQVDSRCSSK